MHEESVAPVTDGTATCAVLRVASIRCFGADRWTWEPIDAHDEANWEGVFTAAWNQHGGIHRTQALAEEAARRTLGEGVILVADTDRFRDGKLQRARAGG